ncbi:hypothetical protein [Paraburkholderia tropica]|uniref:hypothetical protein n=1 Tax=Paraburkholderia tropica TaxID=92647 RepID=UPI001608F639|nr:hypothetical protein [Paraburkholderia tropica]MBB6319248.1 hypothetical protein [Paraburkholderia tropica]
MAAIREVFAAGVLAALEGDASMSQLRFERSLARAISLRANRVAIAVTLGNDLAEENIGRTTWNTELLVHVVLQDDEPDRTADEYLVLAHPIIKRYQHDRLMGITMTRIDEPVYANVGGAVCVRTANYRLDYQTASDSLE